MVKHLTLRTNKFSTYKFLKDFIYLFIFRGEGREKRKRGKEKHQCVIASHATPTGDLAHNSGMCPERESTDDPLVLRPALSPLSHTSQDYNGFMDVFMQLLILCQIHNCFTDI